MFEYIEVEFSLSELKEHVDRSFFNFDHCHDFQFYAKGGKAIVFTQTKRDADEVSVALTASIASEALHGDISQPQRERTLNGFRQGKFTVLVATDVAARGLDIPNVDLVSDHISSVLI